MSELFAYSSFFDMSPEGKFLQIVLSNLAVFPLFSPYFFVFSKVFAPCFCFLCLILSQLVHMLSLAASPVLLAPSAPRVISHSPIFWTRRLTNAQRLVALASLATRRQDSVLVSSPFLFCRRLAYMSFDLFFFLSAACMNHCNSCTTASTCLGCEDDFVLIQGVCTITCPTGAYANGSICEGSKLFVFVVRVFCRFL